MADKELKGRVAIVTGGGRGIGRAIALGLAEAGATVVIGAARSARQLQEVAETAERTSASQITPMTADVTVEADCERMVADTVRLFGGLHILVNNAGRGMKFVSESFIEKPTRFWLTDSATWKMIIDTNVNGPFLMAKAAAPHLIRAGWGRIINISMNFETMRRRGFSPYGPSKAALESETIIWAQDLEGTGVTVNSLLPGGATLTGMIPAGFRAETMPGILDPAIIIPPALWLASRASDGFTGGRYVATRWDATLSPSEAAAKAREPAGWH